VANGFGPIMGPSNGWEWAHSSPYPLQSLSISMQSIGLGVGPQSIPLALNDIGLGYLGR
jgi:hypothetical protein